MNEAKREASFNWLEREKGLSLGAVFADLYFGQQAHVEQVH